MKKPLKVYYDGSCYLCSNEISHYRKIDKNGVCEYISISDPHFDAVKEGLDPKEVRRKMHVRLPNGNLRTGIDAFIAIWNEFPRYHFASKIVSQPLLNPFFKTGYTIFAEYIRPYLPKKKDACESGTCNIHH